jgi:hypothetical protein
MVLVISGDIDGGTVVNRTTDESIHVTGKIDGGSTANLHSRKGWITIDGKVDGSSTANLTAAKDIKVGVVGSDGDKKIDGSSRVTAKAGGSIFFGNKIDGSSQVTANSGGKITLINKIDGSSTVDFQACGGIAIDDKIDGGSYVRLFTNSGKIVVQDKIDNGSTHVQFFPTDSLQVGSGIQGGADVYVYDWAGPPHKCPNKYTVVLMLWGPPQPPKKKQPKKKFWPSTLKGPQLRKALTKISKTKYFGRLKQYNVEQVTVAGGNPPQFANSFKSPTKKFSTRFSMSDVENIITQSFKKGIRSPDKFTSSIPFYIVITPRGGQLSDDHNALGDHDSFRWGPANMNVLYAYVGAQSDLNSTLNVATHEIDEAVGDNGSAPKELCDGCANTWTGGVSPKIGSFTVASYYDADADKCVAPPGFSGHT